jgi:hypothetical protein
MRGQFSILLIAAVCLFSQANTWIPVPGAEIGERRNPAIVFLPDSNRFLVAMGACGTTASQHYAEQVFTFARGQWLNWLPDGILYGVWADSTGDARGNGLWSSALFGSYHVKFMNVSYNGTPYLRPSICDNINGDALAFQQYAYNPDDGKVYFYLSGVTASYNTSTRRWDTLGAATPHPATYNGAVNSNLLWGSLCYDGYNREIVLFGGGNLNQDKGGPGTWTYGPSARTWTKRNQAVEPPGRANGAMVYDPDNQVIVLFGGDHLDYLLSDTWVYDCRTRTWSEKSPNVSPSPRFGHGLLFLPRSRKIVLVFGQEYTSCTDYVCGQYRQKNGEIWRYDVPGNEWALVKSFAASDTQPKFNQPRPYPASMAVNSGDTILAMGGYPFGTYRLACDPSQTDAAGTTSLGVPAGTKTFRGGMHRPAYLTEGVAEPDTAASEAFLRNLPADSFVQLNPPRTPPGSRGWGTSAWDPVNDCLLRWGGGHSDWCGNEVAHYRPKTNRMTLSYPGEWVLEFNYNSGMGWPPHHGFSNRPLMVAHAYESYAFDINLKKMVLVKEANTYLYDALKGDWDSAWIPNHPEMSWGGSIRTSTASTRQGIAALNNNRLFLLDSTTRAWRKLPVRNGLTPPGCYTDETGMSYDSRRDRLLMFNFPNVSIYAFADSTLQTLLPSDTAIARSVFFREGAYLPDQDGVLFMVKSVTNGYEVVRAVFYDCASNAWKEAPGIKGVGARLGSSISLGLHYDEKRGILWNYGDNPRIFALRPGPGMLKGERKSVKGFAQSPFLAFSNPYAPGSAIRISGNHGKGARVRIFDLQGRLVWSAGPLAADESGVFRLPAQDRRGRPFANGVYQVIVQAGKVSMNGRLVLMK